MANEPTGFFILAWIGLSPLWFLILSNSKNTKKVFISCLSWGYFYHGTSLFWITDFHPLTWMNIPWFSSFLFAFLYWFTISSLGAIFITIWGLGLRFVVRRQYNLLTQIISGTAIWCLLEAVFQKTPFWWTSLSLSQSPNNLWILQLNQFSGASVTVALILVVNGLLANLIYSNSHKTKKKLALVTLLTFFSFHILGGFFYFLPDLYSRQEISVGLIQGDIPLGIKFKTEGINLAAKRYLTSYKKLAKKGVDAVATPEIAIPELGFLPNIKKTPFFEPIKKYKIPFWIGTRTGNSSNPQQSLISIDNTGITSQYHKQKLVLFGEYIPFFNTFLESTIRKIYPLKKNHIAGNSNQSFSTPYGKAAVGICYESAYPKVLLNQVRAGGKFILLASANGLFGNQMKAQHHAQDVLRAVELRRWLVKVNSVDNSGIIDLKGNTRLLSSPGYQTIKTQIFLNDQDTIYTHYGDWLTPFLCFLSIGLLASKIRIKILYKKV